MKITLDHNVVIDLLKNEVRTAGLRDRIERKEVDAYVVDMGASEMRERGVRPDRYDLFEGLLRDAGIEHLLRLHPMVIFDVTFLDRAVLADEEMIAKARSIEDVLFGASPSIDVSAIDPDSKQFRKWLNRTCDVHSMWCHLRSGNDVFVTSDANFLKPTKLPQLLALGAGRICGPESL